MSTPTVAIGLFVWIALVTIISVRSRKGMGIGASEYFIGGRRIRGFLSAMTYSATTYSAFMLVGLVGLTYSGGVGALGFEMTYLVFTVVLLVAFAPRFWVAGRAFNIITPPELLAHRYESRMVGLAAGVLCLVMLIPYSSVQLIGAGLLIEGITDGTMSYMTGVLIMAVVSTLSAVYAGMRSVTWTDAFQAIVMLATSLVALFFVFFSFFGSPLEFGRELVLKRPELLQMRWQPAFFIGITLPWAFFALTNPQASQRMFIAADGGSLRRMVVYFSLFGLAYTLITTLFGFQASLILPELENADRAMPLLLAHLPAAMSLLIFIGIFAAAASTLGSIVLTLSSIVSRDVFRVMAPKASEQTELIVGKVFIPVIVAACVVFAWMQPGLIAVLSSMASGGLLVAAPALIGAFFWRRSGTYGALVSILVGGIITGIMYGTGMRPLGWWPSVWGALISAALFIAVSLFERPPKSAGTFLETVGRETAEQFGSARG